MGFYYFGPYVSGPAIEWNSATTEKALAENSYLLEISMALSCLRGDHHFRLNWAPNEILLTPVTRRGSRPATTKTCQERFTGQLSTKSMALALLNRLS